MTICKMNSNSKPRKVTVLICNAYKLTKHKIYLLLNDVSNLFPQKHPLSITIEMKLIKHNKNFIVTGIPFILVAYCYINTYILTVIINIDMRLET